MSSAGKGPSRRFRTTSWIERLVPVILIILAIILVITLAMVVLSLLGLLPAY